MTKADELRALADEMDGQGFCRTAPHMREVADLLDQMAEALRAALIEAERIGIDDLASGFPDDVYEQMRAALNAAGYEVK